MTLLINRNVKAPIDGDFWDMPIRIKIGILFIVFGVLLAFISTMYMLIADPVGFLSQMNQNQSKDIEKLSWTKDFYFFFTYLSQEKISNLLTDKS